MPFVAEKSYGPCVRYQKIATHSLCELYDLTNKITDKIEVNLNVPIMVSLSVEDDVVAPEKTLQLMNNYKGKKKILIYVPEKIKNEWVSKVNSDYPNIINDISWITHNHKSPTPEIIPKAIGHTSILLKESGFAGTHEYNPKYKEFVEQLDLFITNR